MGYSVATGFPSGSGARYGSTVQAQRPTLDPNPPELFGVMPDGTPIHRIVLNSGIRVAILTYGAAIQSIEVPDRDGCVADVVLGLNTLADYIAYSPHFGAVPGRYAGRIRDAHFDLDGVTYDLPRNDGRNTLHGGPDGFGKRAWRLVAYSPAHVDLALTSPDGDAGFPGTLDVRLRYTVDQTTLGIQITATTDRATVLNLTNHAYFNLNGEGSGGIDDHELTIHARRAMHIGPDAMPTGALCPVAGTPLDFTTPRTIGSRLRSGHPQMLRARGYDHAFLLDGTGLRPAARLVSHASGRTLDVLTTQPALQLYTGNTLTGAYAGHSGRSYRPGDAVCLEAQHLPDSPNHPHFPSTVLRPNETFRATIQFRFGVLSAPAQADAQP